MRLLSKATYGNHWRWTIAGALALGIMALFVMILCSTQFYTSDESWHLNGVGLVHKYGWSRLFYVKWHNSTGPLVAWAQWLFEPVTGLGLPGVRLVNAALLVLAQVLLAALLRLITGRWTIGLAGALGLLALPPIWKVAGVVYSEMPAVVMAMLALSVLWLAVNAPQKRGLMLAVVAGLFMSLAILGKQPFLLAACMAFPAALYAPKNRGCLLAFFLASLPWPLWVFSIWGGLQAPILKNSLGDPAVMLGYGLSGLGYIGVFALMLQPAWLAGRSWRGMMGWAVAGGLAFAFLSAWISFTPMQGMMDKLPFGVRRSIRFLSFFLIGGLAVVYLRALAGHLWRVRREGFRAWVAGSLAVLSFLPGVIGPLFSTRYLIPAFPFLIVELVGFQRADRFFPWRCCLGIALGALSLWSHLYTPQGAAFWDNRMEIFYPHIWKGRPEVFAPEQWEKFDYGNSPFIQNPRWGGAVRHPTDLNDWKWPGE